MAWKSKQPLKMAKMCTASKLERQFATLYLFHASMGGGGRNANLNFMGAGIFLRPLQHHKSQVQLQWFERLQAHTTSKLEIDPSKLCI